MSKSFAGARALITGGAGFIGSNLAHTLVGHGCQVTVIDNLLPTFGGNLFNLEPIRDRVHLNFGDVRDEHAMACLVRGQDFVFNLAGQVSHWDSMMDPATDLDINTRAQIVLLEALRKHNPKARVVYTSTRQIYGRPEYLPVDERHPLAPVDANGINKAAGEWYHLLYTRVYDVPTTVLRLTNTYGPRQAIGLNNQGFIGIFVRQSLLGQGIRIYGTGEQLRDFNHVDDVVAALLVSVTHPDAVGRVFNLGAERHYSLLEVVTLLNRLTGVKYELLPFPSEKSRIDIGDYYGAIGAIEQTLGWSPQISLEAGLEQTLAFYREHGAAYYPAS